MMVRAAVQIAVCIYGATGEASFAAKVYADHGFLAGVLIVFFAMLTNQLVVSWIKA